MQDKKQHTILLTSAKWLRLVLVLSVEYYKQHGVPILHAEYRRLQHPTAICIEDTAQANRKG